MGEDTFEKVNERVLPNSLSAMWESTPSGVGFIRNEIWYPFEPIGDFDEPKKADSSRNLLMYHYFRLA
jgi:hypothetical protein